MESQLHPTLPARAPQLPLQPSSVTLCLSHYQTEALALLASGPSRLLLHAQQRSESCVCSLLYSSLQPWEIGTSATQVL